MNLNEIKSILKVVECKKINKAADQLGISQPALSSLLKTVEGRLKIKFFDRLPRGVQLTQEGEIYLKHFQKIVSHLEQAELEVNLLHSEYSESLSLSAHPIIAQGLIEKLEVALRQWPEINIHYIFQSSRSTVEQVVNGFVDFGVAADVLSYPDIIRTKLWSEFVGLYSLSKKKTSTLLFHPETIHVQKYINQLAPEKARKVSDYMIMKSLLKMNSSYMGLLPSSLVEKEKDINLIKKCGRNIDISLVYRADRIKTKSFSEVVNVIKKNGRSKC